VDVLILDTQYTTDEYQDRVGWGHGCLVESVRLAVEAGVRRLILFHHDPAHSDEQIDEMLRQARVHAKDEPLVINAAAEGDVLTFSPDSSAAATPNDNSTGAAASIRGDNVPQLPFTKLPAPTTNYVS
jgi:hypothetical protein